jgi:peptidoglycan/LPS O-acetylase OafA/YrhL
VKGDAPKTAVGSPAVILGDSRANRNIPSLDGLRAISVVLVMLAHSRWFLPKLITSTSVFESVVGNGTHGVAVFFIISGYLITTLLIREFNRDGTVSLKRFYFRRSMRIFPPFYVLLAVMGIFWAAHVIPEDWRSFVSSLTYTWAYYPGAHGYFIAHTWSLSIEEQFYLFWPLMFVILHRKDRLIQVSIWMILLFPPLRVLLYFITPNLRGHEFYMVQGWIDTMMVGCLLALLRQHDAWQKWRSKYINGWTVIAMTIIAFYFIPIATAALPKSLGTAFALTIAPTIVAFSIGGAMIYLIDARQPLVFNLLNNPVIRHIGVISYSLYLWQQLFMSQQLSLLPYGYLLVFIVAEASFWLIEKPSLALRARLESTRPN